MGSGHRARDPRPPEDADEDVLPLRARVLRRAELADVSRLPRLPRRAPGAERPRRRVHDQARARSRLRDRRARRLRAEELLLPRPPEGLPDLPVRQAALPGRLPAGAGPRGRAAGRHHPRASRGGRGEDDSRRRGGGAHRRRRAQASSTSIAAGRRWLEIVTEPDIHSSEEARALPPAAAPDDRGARDLRRRDGEGHAPLSTPTSRCGRLVPKSCGRAAS